MRAVDLDALASLPVATADLPSLRAWLTRDRVPPHPLTPMERGELGELPWHEQRDHDRAVDRACSPSAVLELLEEHDLAADAREAREARLSHIPITRTPWRS